MAAVPARFPSFMVRASALVAAITAHLYHKRLVPRREPQFAGQQPVQCFPVEQVATQNDGTNPFGIAYVLERIRIEQHQIRELSRRHGTGVLSRSEKLCRV